MDNETLNKKKKQYMIELEKVTRERLAVMKIQMGLPNYNGVILALMKMHERLKEDGKE